MNTLRARPFLMAGGALLLLWSLAQWMPASPLLAVLDRIPEHMDSGDLFIAASLVVVTNGFRAILLYLGWFLTGTGLASLSPLLRPLSWAIPATAIPMTYFILPSLVEGMQIHFGIPAVLSVSSVLMLRHLTRNVPGWWYKSIAMALFVFSFQWLDIIPALTAWGAGWGELSAAVKQAAMVMGREWFLNWTGGAVFLGFFLSGVLATKLLVSYSAQLAGMALVREKEREMALLRERNLNMRSIAEMQHLVHDLKRPLTTIIGLADVILSGKGGQSVRRYGEVISEAGRSMEEMVSEILRDDFRRVISLGGLMDNVFSQISPFPWRETVVLEGDEQSLSAKVAVNVVRLSRAIVNLLDNASRANCLSGGTRIEVIVGNAGNLTRIAIRDQGPGFSASGGGDSGWNSTGLGLEYVKMVVEKHGGQFIAENNPGGGAEVTILLPRNTEREDAGCPST